MPKDLDRFTHPAGTPAARQRLERFLDDAGRDAGMYHIYTTMLGPRALERARALDAKWASCPDPHARAPALLGVPIAVKDNIDVAGVETSRGLGPAGPAARADAAIVKALEARGAVVAAKTNLDEAALGASGRNSRFGRCINPREPGRSSGGSSSGSAASVAAGHVALAVGTDTLGSVRIPAAFCGVAGFKPTHGRWALDGVAPLYPRFDTVGLLGESVGALAHAAASLMSGERAPGATPGVPIALAHLDEAALMRVEPAVADAYRHCLDRLRAVPGVHLSAAPAIDYESLARSAFIEVAHDFAVNSHRAAPGYLPLDGAGVSLCRVLERARAVSPGRLLHGRELIAQAASRLDGWLRTADALLMPTCPGPACSTDEEPSDNVSAFVAPANIAGLPAVCWPQTMPRAAGLSLQLIGRRADDLRLLGLALCIERALLAAAEGSD